MPRRSLLAALALLSCTAAAGPTAPPAARTHAGWARTAQGCGDFQVHVSHANKRRLLHIRSSRDALGLTAVGAVARVSLAAAGPLQLSVEHYSAPGAEEHHCNDVVSDAAPVRRAELPAVAGTVTVRLTSLVDPENFRLEISLQGVAVRAPNGKLEPIPDATFSDIHVGWLPG